MVFCQGGLVKSFPGLLKPVEQEFEEQTLAEVQAALLHEQLVDLVGFVLDRLGLRGKPDRLIEYLLRQIQGQNLLQDFLNQDLVLC